MVMEAAKRGAQVSRIAVRVGKIADWEVFMEDRKARFCRMGGFTDLNHQLFRVIEFLEQSQF